MKEKGQAYVIKALIAIPAVGAAFYFLYTFFMGRGDMTGILPALNNVGNAEETHFTDTHNNLSFIIEMLPIFIIILVFIYVIYHEKNPEAGGWPR